MRLNMLMRVFVVFGVRVRRSAVLRRLNGARCWGMAGAPHRYRPKYRGDAFKQFEDAHR